MAHDNALYTWIRKYILEILSTMTDWDWTLFSKSRNEVCVTLMLSVSGMQTLHIFRKEDLGISCQAVF